MQGLLGTAGYQDDILVTGKDDAEHMANLDAVLHSLSTAALCVNKDKCVFMVSEATYLGYRIDEKGLHPTKEKVRAIVEVPAPTNVSWDSLTNLSSVLAPMHDLLQKNINFKWGKSQQDASVQNNSSIIEAFLFTLMH